MRPGLLSAPHAVEVRGISRVEVGCTADELDGWVEADVPVQPLGGDGGLRAVVIATRGRGDPPHRRFMKLG